LAESTIKWPGAGRLVKKRSEIADETTLHPSRAAFRTGPFDRRIHRGFATPSLSQNVPVPKPAPKAREGGVQMSAQDNKGPMTTGATQTPPNPVIPIRAAIPRPIFCNLRRQPEGASCPVSSYLSSLQTLVGNFVQVGPDGSKTKGDFYIQKPGKVRFEYEAPSRSRSSPTARRWRCGTRSLRPGHLPAVANTASLPAV